MFIRKLVDVKLIVSVLKTMLFLRSLLKRYSFVKPLAVKLLQLVIIFDEVKKYYVFTVCPVQTKT